MITSTGSPLAPDSFDYVYRSIKSDVPLTSISGGTDIMGCFALGNPLLPVYRGELQCRGLGMAVEIYDEEGHSLPLGRGELVCTRPFPSMPVGFWNDRDGRRFRNAYFERFPGVWCHGDFVELTDVVADTHDDREDHRQIEISGREIRDQEDDRRQEIFGELIKRGLHRRRFDWSGAETLSERRSRCDPAVRAGC